MTHEKTTYILEYSRKSVCGTHWETYGGRERDTLEEARAARAKAQAFAESRGREFTSRIFVCRTSVTLCEIA